MLLLLLAIISRSDAASIDGCDLPGAVCSAGAVGHFEGDVTSATALRQAVRACSHKRELVLLAAGDQRWAVLDALNLVDNLRALRIAHVLLLVPGKRVCDHARRFAPDTCCVWSSEPLRIRGGAGKKAVFVRRLRLLARVLALPAALRVNVLFMDSDVVVSTNPCVVFCVFVCLLCVLFCPTRGVRQGAGHASRRVSTARTSCPHTSTLLQQTAPTNIITKQKVPLLLAAAARAAARHPPRARRLFQHRRRALPKPGA